MLASNSDAKLEYTNIPSRAVCCGQVCSYQYVDGMESILAQLHEAQVPMHVMSNYPVWWRNVDSQLNLSAYIPWTFVSCEGPMKGMRKPQPECFACVQAHVQDLLGNKTSQLLLIDDRTPNVEGAVQAGWDGIVFKNAKQLQQELEHRGIL